MFACCETPKLLVFTIGVAAPCGKWARPRLPGEVSALLNNYTVGKLYQGGRGGYSYEKIGKLFGVFRRALPFQCSLGLGGVRFLEFRAHPKQNWTLLRILGVGRGIGGEGSRHTTESLPPRKLL